MKMARMPGTTPRTADHAASKSDRNVASAACDSGAAGSRSPMANAHGDGQHGARRDQEGGLHAEHPAEHQEDDRSDDTSGT